MIIKQYKNECVDYSFAHFEFKLANKCIEGLRLGNNTFDKDSENYITFHKNEELNLFIGQQMCRLVNYTDFYMEFTVTFLDEDKIEIYNPYSLEVIEIIKQDITKEIFHISPSSNMLFYLQGNSVFTFNGIAKIEQKDDISFHDKLRSNHALGIL